MAEETAPDPLQGLGRARARDGWLLRVAYHADPRFIGARCALSGRVQLGRGGDAFGAGAMDDALLSRKHATIEAGARVTVRDEGSRNGTFVDGARVERAELGPESVLGIGGILLVLERAPAHFDIPSDPALAGVSHALARLLDDIAAVASQDVTVLLRGETGAGKEVVARRIHERSGRRGAFVAVNCGGVSDGVVHSELFGHVRGAFSGADADRTGLVETAAGGTLFLDEIGDASDKLQVSLLRLLQDRDYRKVGSDAVQQSDARFIAATHVRLDPAVAEGRFREDLLARLRRWVITIPPLRERRADIIPIALRLARERLGPHARIDRALAQALLTHRGPDTARGLAAVIDIAAITAQHGELSLGERVVARLGEAGAPPPSASPSPIAPYKQRRPDRAQLEQRLAALSGNVKALAAELGIARNTLYRWFEEEGIDPKAMR